MRKTIFVISASIIVSLCGCGSNTSEPTQNSSSFIPKNTDDVSEAIVDTISDAVDDVNEAITDTVKKTEEELLYEEKSKVSNDVSLADSVHSAVYNAIYNLSNNNPGDISDELYSFSSPTAMADITKDRGPLSAEILLTLKAESGDEINAKLQSTGASAVFFEVLDSSPDHLRVHVWVEGSDATGYKGESYNSSMIEVN